jgi:hypothetical protein
MISLAREPTIPRSRRRSGLATTVIILTLMTAVAARAAPASASARPVADCTATSGVILAVDFGYWGGPTLRSCGSTPTTGYALLNEGGWHTTGTEHDGPDFVCRIGYNRYHEGLQYPAPRQEACVLTPPVNAYWTYWQASPGQDTWIYSQAGPMSVDPAPGSIDLWIFGGTSIGGSSGSAVPRISPDSIRSRVAARTTSAGKRQIINAPPAPASVRGGRGSPGPAIATLTILVVLAAAGITATRRRRDREQQAR